MTTASQPMRLHLGKFFQICPKSFARNDLRRAKPPRRDLSPYVATTYDDSAEQMVCQKKFRNIPRIIVDEGLTLTMYMV